MTKAEFLQQFDEVIEAEPGTTRGEQLLAETEGWDSLAVMGFLAMADEQFGVTLPAQSIADATTVDDLAALLGDKISD